MGQCQIEQFPTTTETNTTTTSHQSNDDDTYLELITLMAACTNLDLDRISCFMNILIKKNKTYSSLIESLNANCQYNQFTKKLIEVSDQFKDLQQFYRNCMVEAITSKTDITEYV